MYLLGRWKFEVYQMKDGDVETYWSVTEFEEGTVYDEHGVTRGGLWDAIPEAATSMGILCPLLPDPDLMELAGHRQREEDE